jgi:dTMP kinase
MKGIFITFEGVEGSGKTTQARRLFLYLQKRCNNEKERHVLFTREPGGREISEKIRKLLLDRNHGEMAPLTELFLYLASRTQHVTDVIRPALDSNAIVICDRFADASVAYQGEARKIDRSMIRKLNEMATDGVMPDLTFLIDIDPEEGMRRKTTMVDDTGEPAGERDRIESESIEFHRAVRKGYLDIAREEPERVVVVNGNRSPELIFEEITAIFGERFGADTNAIRS